MGILNHQKIKFWLKKKNFRAHIIEIINRIKNNIIEDSKINISNNAIGVQCRVQSKIKL